MKLLLRFSRELWSVKLIHFFGNPYWLISSFLFLLISGESNGGFYLFYIFIALPHLGVHALLAVCGVVIVIFNFHFVRDALISRLLLAVGLTCMTSSIYYFFSADGSRYNLATFGQVMPVLTFVLFGFFMVCAVMRALRAGPVFIGR